MDLLEPGHKSLGGRYYALTIIDDYTRKLWVFPLARKSDAFGAFKNWIAHVENETDLKVKSARSDNGGEFLSKEFRRFLNERGIRPDLSVAYTPQQNGRAERPNRDLKERTIALLQESGLPFGFWAEAMLTIAYTKNRSHHTSIDDVPERLWRKGTPPNVSMLRSFGCRAWMTIPRQKRRGLQPKGLATIFVGYEPNVKGYRLWDPVSKKTLVSRDVRFEEDVYPMRDKSGGGQLSSAPPMVRPTASEPLFDAVLTPLAARPEQRDAAPARPVEPQTPIAAPVPVPPAPRTVRFRDNVDVVDPESPLRGRTPARERSESPDPIDMLRDVHVPAHAAGGPAERVQRDESPDPLAMPAKASNNQRTLADFDISEMSALSCIC